jgi:formate hydrogenlyase subunit 3/multisubunit Na+/H+ antiporter MnhD subunit
LDDPQLLAIVTYGMLLSFNLFSLFVFLDEAFNQSRALQQISYLDLGIFITAVGFLVYLIFLRDRRYLTLEIKFDKIKYAKEIGNVLTSLYILATIATCCWVLYMNKPIRDLWFK